MNDIMKHPWFVEKMSEEEKKQFKDDMEETKTDNL